MILDMCKRIAESEGAMQIMRENHNMSINELVNRLEEVIKRDATIRSEEDANALLISLPELRELINLALHFDIPHARYINSIHSQISNHDIWERLFMDENFNIF